MYSDYACVLNGEERRKEAAAAYIGVTKIDFPMRQGASFAREMSLA